MQVGERNIIYLLSIAKLPSGRRRGCWGPGRLRMFASADFLAEGRSLSLDQTVPRQLKLSSKKSRTQLLSSPLVLRHQEKIKEATEPAQSTLPSPSGARAPPAPTPAPGACAAPSLFTGAHGLRPSPRGRGLSCSDQASATASLERRRELGSLPPSSLEHSSPYVPPHVRGLLSSLLFGVLGG